MSDQNFAEVRSVTLELCQKRGRHHAIGLLSWFGATKAYELPPSSWSDYIKLARGIIEGGEAPSATPTRREEWVTFISPEVQAERRANAAMIARDGPQLVKRVSRAAPVAPVSTAKAPLCALTLTPDLSDTSHQVRPAFGSAWLVG